MFTFPILAGEALGARLVRCAETSLADGPMGFNVRGDDYAIFINGGLKPAGRIGSAEVDSIASWHTSCALYVRALMMWCLRAMGIAVNGSPIATYLDLTVGGPLWVPSAGGKILAEPGDVPLWYTSGPDAHVEIVLRVQGDGHVETAGGGGGTDGTGCSLRLRAPGLLDPYGRHLHGVFRLARATELFPASPDAAIGERVEPNAGDELAPTGRAIRGELAGIIHAPEYDAMHPDDLRSLVWAGGIAA